MDKSTIRYTSYAINILSKILGSNFSVNGLEKIPQKPVLFVANHFTRSETFLIPYLIYKYTGRQVRCLADSSLFHGVLGNFLSSVGAISTSDKNRDKIIVNDLVNAQFDWMIYPEGSMIKNKKIENKKGYINYTSSRIGRVRTGSAVLALKAEIYRRDIINAYKNSDTDILNYFKKKFGLAYHHNFKDIDTAIVPVSITYYPLRPGENKIQKILKKFIKNLPKQALEELEIEGNLLSKAEIDVGFGDPIYLRDYIKLVKPAIDQLPILGHEFKSNLVIKYFKNSLTNQFMTSIYQNIEINFDHIFAASLFYIDMKKISVLQLKQIIYLSAIKIRKFGKFRLNSSLDWGNLVKIFSDEKYHLFDDVFSLAKQQHILEVDEEGFVSVANKAFDDDEDFHEIRRENSLRVILNEFVLLDKANLLVRKTAKSLGNNLGYEVFLDILKSDQNNFHNDYQQFYDKEMSKDAEVGLPFSLNCKTDNKSESGVLLVHGYKSTPKEVESLGQFLAGYNFKVYGVRLKGHGTAPLNLKYVNWQDWYDSVQVGYAALRNLCKKIIIIGFSTGGLLSLLMLANKNKSSKFIAGVVSINSALKLRDIRSHLVPGINIWNDILDRFHIEKGHFEYIENIAENPHINYSRNYLSGVEELGKLMAKVEKSLYKINGNILLIQSDEDPVVNPKSSKIIFREIINAKKELYFINSKRHVIITGQDSIKTFEAIKNYLAKIKIIE